MQHPSGIAPCPLRNRVILGAYWYENQQDLLAMRSLCCKNIPYGNHFPTCRRIAIARAVRGGMASWSPPPRKRAADLVTFQGCERQTSRHGHAVRSAQEKKSSSSFACPWLPCQPWQICIFRHDDLRDCAWLENNWSDTTTGPLLQSCQHQRCDPHRPADP